MSHQSVFRVKGHGDSFTHLGVLYSVIVEYHHFRRAAPFARATGGNKKE